jgi:hypothetical protein
MNGSLIFVSNVIHTSTRNSLDSTDVALATEYNRAKGESACPKEAALPAV